MAKECDECGSNFPVRDCVSCLQARVKELEEHRYILGENVALLAVINGKLRKVVDAARGMHPETDCGRCLLIRDALRELDGPK
jgi:hypothetical protein